MQMCVYVGVGVGVMGPWAEAHYTYIYSISQPQLRFKS